MKILLGGKKREVQFTESDIKKWKIFIKEEAENFKLGIEDRSKLDFVAEYLEDILVEELPRQFIMDTIICGLLYKAGEYENIIILISAEVFKDDILGLN